MIPVKEVLTHQIKDATICNHIDCIQGFWQIKLTQDWKALTVAF